jgi:hypothetical protein
MGRQAEAEYCIWFTQQGMGCTDTAALSLLAGAHKKSAPLPKGAFEMIREESES